MTRPVVLALPITDRVASYAFYADGLGFATAGAPGDDGVPEPLQLAVHEGLRIMLVPRGGFGWVIGDRSVAPLGQQECVIGLVVDDDAAVDAFVDRAQQAGATVVAAPAAQPWGYAGLVADPDGHLWQVTSAPAPG